ncbi:FtsK/SpoIIIE domain-containing protein [Frigoribacterium sp. 2-23]|uniref:FtsK/SpoIIIE domain-containing protein n=1 Tax=Frigoribacterium sp. 2-23 TaxID=3415006 RepID=UPI003C6EEF98
MRVFVTVVDDLSGRREDVLIDAPGDTPLRHVFDALGRECGALSRASLDVDDDTTFARSGLLDGALLHVGSPPPPPDTLGPAEARVVGGRGTGRIAPLLVGRTPVALDADGGLVFGASELAPVAEIEIAFDAGARVRRRDEGAPLRLEDDDLDAGGAWHDWPVASRLAVGETLVAVQPTSVADVVLLRAPDSGWVDFNRPPRLLPPTPPVKYTIPKVPTPPQRSPLPWIMAAVPAVFGLVMAVAFQHAIYLMFAFMSPVMMIGTTITNRRNGKKSHGRALAEHREQVALIERYVDESVTAERDRRRADAADAAELRVAARVPTRRLWERRPTDPDHLHVRVGTADLPSTVQIQDDRSTDPRAVPTGTTRRVPVTVSLARSGVVGVAGADGWQRRIARWLVGQLAVAQSPHDVRVVVLTSVAALPSWRWTTWLPHARPPEGSEALAAIGADSETIGRRLAELSLVLQERRDSMANRASRATRFSPEYVVVLDGARRLRAMPGVVGLLRHGPECGIRVICADDEEWQLPEECTATVVQRSDTRLVLRRHDETDVDDVLADLVDDDWYDEVARDVSPVRDISSTDSAGLVPDKAALLPVLGLELPTGDRIADRWSERGASTEAVVGVSIDGPFSIDLVKDGPHGLVAGTTGSGKSEFLQTLVASLAVSNRPDAMTFVLVDYKGGAAFSAVADLPHTVGLVTDLDSHLVERALRSLRSELTRREHQLAAASAKDIEDYDEHLARGGAGERLPRLVIVIDEFAALAKELPDFVTGLVGIAQRGRSLGVHLILATQRPSGVISPEIRANTNLRVALRMTDNGESSDVIDIPDAARIAKSLPGRAYARLGHSSVVPFQSARVGGRSTSDSDGSAAAPFVRLFDWRQASLGLPERPSVGVAAVDTDLAVLVTALSSATDLLAVPAQRSPWLAPLPDVSPLTLTDPEARAGSESPLAFTWGTEDLPDRQEQRSATIDLDRFGHLYVVGAPGSGRSQALRSIASSAAAALSTADLHVYGLDCGNGGITSLGAFPHTGAVAQRTQLDRATRLIDRLIAEMGRRHDVVGAAGVANITEQRATAPAGARLPHILFVIDRWENFVGTLGEIDGGRLTDSIHSLLRDGASAGVHLVISGDRSLLTSRMAVLTDDKVVLRLTDRLDYSLAAIDHKSLPSDIAAGRGFRAGSGVEVQVGVLGDDVSGQAQVAAVRELAARLHEVEPVGTRSVTPLRVDDLPSDLDLDTALGLAGADAARPLWALLGVGGDEMTAQGIDLENDAPTFVVAGPSRSGRSTMLLTMAESLLRAGTELVVVCPRPSPLRGLAGRENVRGVLTGVDLTDADLEPLLAPDGRPVALVVDDGELLLDIPAKAWLRSYVQTAADHRRGLLLGGNSTGLCAGFTGWQVDAKKNRRGALLSPQATIDGDLIGVRVTRSMVSAKVTPGRALVHLGSGEPFTVQVPVAAAATPDAVPGVAS